MTEIEKILKILKARWPEVMLIISLTLLGPLTIKLSNYFAVKQLLLHRQLPWLFMAVRLLTIIAHTLLSLGFLRTVYTENQKRQSVGTLLQTGKIFFGRMFALGCLYAVPLLIIALIAGFLSHSNTIWFYALSFAGLKLILIKIILLIPALIIVLDCGVFESFRFLRCCKLSNAKTLVMLFFIGIALSLLWVIISKLSLVLPALHFILTLAQGVASKFIWLMIGVTAVRFVASLNLVYDNKSESLDFDDLRQ